MRFTMLAAATVAATAFLLPTAAMAQDQRDFTLINGTGRTITQLFISPATTNDWEEDVLGVDTLEDSAKVDVHFQGDADTCVYDLKIVHDDGDAAVWGAIDLCKVNYVSVQYQDDGTPIAQSGVE